MSFQIRNTTVDSAVNKVAFDNAPPITFPQLVSATAVLTAPVTTYESNLPLTEVGTSTNVTVNSDNMYNNIYGNSRKNTRQFGSGKDYEAFFIE